MLMNLLFPAARFLRTHPMSEKRVQVIKQQLPGAMEVYMESGCTLKSRAVRRWFQGDRGPQRPPVPQEATEEWF